MRDKLVVEPISIVLNDGDRLIVQYLRCIGGPSLEVGSASGIDREEPASVRCGVLLNQIFGYPAILPLAISAGRSTSGRKCGSPSH